MKKTMIAATFGGMLATGLWFTAPSAHADICSTLLNWPGYHDAYADCENQLHGRPDSGVHPDAPAPPVCPDGSAPLNDPAASGGWMKCAGGDTP